MLQHAMGHHNFMLVRTGIIALLAFVLALHAGFGGRIAQAEAAIKIPCCGTNCPVPLSASDRSCCEVQHPGPTAEAISAKPNLPSLEPLTAFIHPWVVIFSSAPNPDIKSLGSPPGSARLAILCSRQI
jgi:hypothetical protein